MKEQLITDILKFGQQIPRKNLEDLSIESLQTILKLRQDHAKTEPPQTSIFDYL